jgi:hypothetical protein
MEPADGGKGTGTAVEVGTSVEPAKKPRPPQRYNGGRKPHQPTDVTRRAVERFSAMGQTQVQICQVMGMSEVTLRKFYHEELKTAAIKANADVAQSLFYQAVGGPKRDWTRAVTTAGIWWSKSRMGWKEQPLEVTTPDGKPFQVEDVTAREFIARRIASLAANLRSGEDPKGPDGGAASGADGGLGGLLGSPGTSDAEGQLGDVAGAGGPGIREDEDGSGSGPEAGVRFDPPDRDGL